MSTGNSDRMAEGGELWTIAIAGELLSATPVLPAEMQC
jgi:hypothetical protein